MSSDANRNSDDGKKLSEHVNEDLICNCCGGLSAPAVNALYKKEGGFRRKAKFFKVRLRARLEGKLLLYLGPCRGCSLICDGIDALQLDIESIEDVVICYGLRQVELVQTICMKFCFKDGKESDWYQFYCTPDQISPRMAISDTLSTISGDVTSRQALEWTLNRLRDCKSHHSQCLPYSQKEPLLPSRVLDLGSSSDTRPAQSVTLIETKAKMARYICLSYCWGKCFSLTTTKDNYSRHKAGIPISSLARTHREAVEFTRRLGMQYLWIDALCIIQGDKEDWQLEASKMYEYYQNAELTLAADLGIDSEAGLYAGSVTANEASRKVVSHALLSDPSPSTEVCVRQALKHVDIFHRETDVTDQRSPLMKRGWVYQERFLSPRYLHFGKELIWECNTHLTCECSVLDNLNIWAADPIRKDKARLAALPRQGNLDKVIVHWKFAVIRYSSLDLTYQSDRLLAISGIAKYFSQFKCGPYYAGLWRDKFLVQLVWYADNKALKARVRQWDAPTWSWASVHGQIYYSPDLNIESRSECKIIDIDCGEIVPGSFGGVKSGRLTIHGHLISVRHKWEPPEDPCSDWTKSRHVLIFGNGDTECAIPDYAWYSNGYLPPDAPYPSNETDHPHFLGDDEELQLLQVAGDVSLVLRRANGFGQDYERIGLVFGSWRPSISSSVSISIIRCS
ncbi:HET-domain-containing protein [Acephala macrosclerotiorum]|nr:HET-domain-containing protein [Acephala macrosclerotiorum]